MIDENYELEFRNELQQALKGFTNSFVEYLNKKVISNIIQELFDKIQLELFIWSFESPDVAKKSLSDDIKPIQIKVDEVIEIIENPKDYIERKKKQDFYIFSPDVVVRYNNSNKFISEFCVVWGIALDKDVSAIEKIMAEVLLDFLQKCFDSIECLQTMDVSAWKAKEEKFNFDIIGAYVKKVFSTLPIPSEDIIRQISFEPYEGSEVCASIYFVDENACNAFRKNEQKGFVWIEKDPAKDMSNKNNVSSVRKMLETCKSGNVLLVQIGKDHQYPIVAVANKTKSCFDSLQYKLEFCSRGKWKFWSGKDVILEYREGVYSINEQHIELNIAEKVNLITEIKDSAAFVSAFEHLCSCSHGALMIVGGTKDIQNEVERLSRLSKGTMVEGEGVEIGDENNLLLKGLASIDGAVMVDYEGRCYGFGIILDGKTKIKGDVGRGSRYNSAKNYVCGHKRYAVVFSEDKTKGIGVINGMDWIVPEPE